jgi:hypothetical protein
MGWIISLSVVVLILTYIGINLYSKVVKQEDIIEYQIDYLRKVSFLIQESKIYVEQLDEKGIFRSDDEIGTFFNFMKEIQDTINTFQLPENYGKKEK